jgi:hypothetical protein
MTNGLILTATTADTVELAPPDWFEPSAEYETFYIDVGDSLLAYTKPGSANDPAAFEVWRTTDGTNWDSLGPPRGFPYGYQPEEISGGDGLYLIYLNDTFGENDPGPDFLTIQSEDGIDWAPADQLVAGGGSIHRVGAGWVFVAPLSRSNKVLILTSSNGTDWERIDTSDLPGAWLGRKTEGDRWQSAGNALFVTATGDNPPLERLWLVRFPSATRHETSVRIAGNMSG